MRSAQLASDFEQPGRLVDLRQGLRLVQQPLIERARSTCDQLELRVTDDGVGQPLERPRQRRVRDQRGEQQRDADGDAGEGEQLLADPAAQADQVQAGDVAQAHVPAVSAT